jgi:hypothetical protein
MHREATLLPAQPGLTDTLVPAFVALPLFPKGSQNDRRADFSARFILNTGAGPAGQQGATGQGMVCGPR